MNRRTQLLLLAVLCAAAAFARAYPVAEKSPAAGSAPLDLLSSQPERIIVPAHGDFADKYMFVVDGSASLGVIDLETWEEYVNPPEAFSTTVADAALLGNGTSLIVALTSGNIARIELNDETTFFTTETATTEEDTDEESDNDTTDDSDNDTSDDDDDDEEADDELADSREIASSADMTSAGITAIAADDESDAEYVYMINGDDGYYYEFRLDNESLTEMSFATSDTESDTSSDGEEDSTTTTTAPGLTGIAYANSSGGDKVLITTDDAQMIVVEPLSGGSYTSVTATPPEDNDETPSFAGLALTSDDNYAFVADTANDYLWVFSVERGEFVDQISGGTSLDPITFDPDNENDAITNAAVFHDEAANKDYVYVSGSLGLSVADAADPGNAAESKLLDADATDAGDYDPITLAGTPGPLAVSSSADGYLYSANGDALISVLTENPWVTISSLSAETITEASSIFTVTFQTDTAGTYVVKVNSDPSGASGTELIGATAVDTADTDVTTATIDINSFAREVFEEGDNKIHVFVTDGDGFTGRDADYISVDRPPGPLDITSVNFGDEKVYVYFNQSEDDDIATYTAYAEPAESQSSPSCPGSLTFASSAAVASELAASACDGNPCENNVTGLANGTAYCVAVRATDEAGQAGTLTAYTSAVTPEETVGPAGFMGETGCRLDSRGRGGKRREMIWTGAVVFCILLAARRRPSVIRLGQGVKTVASLIVLASALLIPSAARASEEEEFNTDPKHWTFETRVSNWMPTRAVAREFFPFACCNLLGEFEFGYIHADRYNAVLSAGFSYLSGNSLGINNGLESGDPFTLYLIPVRASFIYRFVWLPDQLLVPYLNAGADAVLFRERTEETIQGVKFGLHGGGGLAFLLDRIDGSSVFDTAGSAINDVYLTIEARYAYINSFRSRGLDLSGLYPYVGVLFQF